MLHLRKTLPAAGLIVVLCLLTPNPSAQGWQESVRETNRRTPLVDAVARVRPSVVNLRGKKTVADPNSSGAQTQAVRQVNGMGTGVIIDARGYILTNYHVVEEVRHIKVTLADGTVTTGTLVSHDDVTDLALVKIQVPKPLPVVPIGTSSDVMLAETVAALGNAYGYEDTVTRGIISEIGRTVQVSDDQIYENLLQTDAPINPGNSGGPLINLDGEMIGINVAVRVGAQGIAFAIPVNDAVDVATEFLRELNERRFSAGLVLSTVYHEHRPSIVVRRVDAGDGAESGLRPGDEIVDVAGTPCLRALDVERAMLDRSAGDTLSIRIRRDGQEQTVSHVLAAPRANDSGPAWQQLGIRVTAVSGLKLRDSQSKYDSGLRVDRVRPGSPAAREGIRDGDILVAMHGWRTESVDNLKYVLALQEVAAGQQVVFYIIRNQEPFYGNIRIANVPPVVSTR